MSMACKIGPALVSILVTIGAASCQDAPDPAASGPAQAEPRTVVIGYSAPKLVGGQLNIHQSLERYARAKKWQLITTTSDGDPQRQVEQIESFVALGIQAIVAVPEDSRRVCAGAEAARAAKVPFYTIDRAPEGCAIDMAVLSDNHMAGRQSGEALVALLQQRHGAPKGTVLEITGNTTQNVAQLRGAGFHDVVDRHPDIRVVRKVGDWNDERGEVIVRDVLASTPELDGIYMHSDSVYLPGTLKVLRDLGRLSRRGEPGHLFLVGVDGSVAAVQAIKDGYVDQASNQPIPDFGIIVDWIEAELRGEHVTEQEVRRDGALWSPARVKTSDTGPQLFLSTTSVTESNANDPRLWANQP